MLTRQDISNYTAQTTRVCAIVYALFFASNFSFADDIQKQIDAIKHRLDAVQNETEDMRGTLDELKAENSDWLTKERAEEIQHLVHDVLSDADSRTSLTGDGILGGWSDGFFLASSDGRFKLKVGGLIQERYMLNYLWKYIGIYGKI